MTCRSEMFPRVHCLSDAAAREPRSPQRSGAPDLYALYASPDYFLSRGELVRSDHLSTLLALRAVALHLANVQVEGFFN